MRNVIALCLLVALTNPELVAQGVSETDITTAEQFALNGLALEPFTIFQPIDDVIAKYGLPDDIDIRESAADWDIDLESTPVIWSFSGFTVTTQYLRDGRVVPGERYLVPGPYREDRRIVGLTVFDSGIELLFGLHVGMSILDVIEKFGEPRRYNPNSTVVAYGDGADLRTGVDVRFHLDEPQGTVQSIEWILVPWH